MKVLRNYLYNVGYQILVLILPLITAPYASRVLKASGIGINAYTNSWIQYFILFGSIGIALYGNREIAYLRDDPQAVSRAFWEIQILKTITITLACIAYALFLQVYTRNHTYMVLQAINLIAVAFDITWFYNGLEDFKHTALRNTFVRILSVILIFTLVKTPDDLGLYIVILGGTTLLGNLALWPRLRKMLVKVKVSVLHPLKHLHPTLILFAPQIATQVYLVLNKTMLGAMVNTDAAGYYNFSDNLIKMVLALATSMSAVLMPRVSNEFSKGRNENVNNFLYIAFDFVSFLGIAMWLGIAGIALHFGPYFYGPEYEPVGPAMLIESVIIVLIGWSNTTGLQYLMPVDRLKEFTTSVVLGAVVNIILNVPLIYLWGLNGAMIATVLSEAVVTGYQLWVIRKDVELKKMFINVPKYLIAGVTMFIPVYWINTHVHTSILTIFADVLLGIVIYGLMILLLRPTIIKNVKELIRR